jgi:hypothetical protein
VITSSPVWSLAVPRVKKTRFPYPEDPCRWRRLRPAKPSFESRDAPRPTIPGRPIRRQNLDSGVSAPCDVGLAPIAGSQNKDRLWLQWRGPRIAVRGLDCDILKVLKIEYSLERGPIDELTACGYDTIWTEKMAGVVRAARQTAPVLARQTCFRQLVFAVGSIARGFRAAPGTRLSLNCSRSFSHSRHWRSVAVPAVDRGGSKLWRSADEAVADIRSGSVVLSAGFGLCGIACKFTRIRACRTGKMTDKTKSNTYCGPSKPGTGFPPLAHCRVQQCRRRRTRRACTPHGERAD